MFPHNKLADNAILEFEFIQRINAEILKIAYLRGGGGEFPLIEFMTIERNIKGMV